MNQLNKTFQIWDEETRNLKYPIETIQSKITHEFIDFRKKVCEEILKENNRDAKLITFIKHSEWTLDYSQVFYDGIFQGHLYEDFINLNFRFQPK